MAIDPRRLARFVTARRQELGLSQMDVAARGGPSDTTLSKVEAAIGSPNRQTLRKLDIALGWADGSARRVLEKGGEPQPVVEERPVPHYDWQRLAKLVRLRREEAGMSHAEVTARGGPPEETLVGIEAGRRVRDTRVLSSLEQALGWRRGTVEQILLGRGLSYGESTYAEPPTPHYDWQRLANHVRLRREEAGLSQAEAAIRGSLAEDTFARIEAGQRVRHQRVLSALDQAMAWSQGSSERVLKGGDPRPHPGPLPRALSRYEALARAERSPLRRPARRLTDLTYEDLFDRWARLFAQSLAIEMEYARRRGLSQPGEARDELYEVLVMADQGREGRPWVPPWEEMSDDEAQDQIDALREAGLIDEHGEPIMDEDEETTPPQPIPEPELDDAREGDSPDDQEPDSSDPSSARRFAGRTP